MLLVKYDNEEPMLCMTDDCPPNGLAFSCGERAATTCQNSPDLAREAVSWNAVLGLFIE
jgi:hypothetical protein